MVCLRGTLTNDLPECQTFRSDDDGALYSLECAPEGFSEGEAVIVCGRLLDSSFSHPVRPIVVTSISRPCGAADA